MIDHFFTRHTDTIIADGYAALVLVITDLDLELDIFLVQTGIRDRSEAQSVAGIGGVGY